MIVCHQALVFIMMDVLRQRLPRAANLQDNAASGATVGHVWHNNPVVRRGGVEPSDLAAGLETVVANVAAVILGVDLTERQPQSTKCGCPSLPRPWYWDGA